MASSFSTGSVVVSRRVEHIQKYHWPALQLNVWIVIMLAAAGAIIGIFANFITVQHVLMLGIPWYFPYCITVGVLTVLFVALLLWLIFVRRLLPAIVMLGGFVLFVLWTVGLVVVAVELWGSSGVAGDCNLAVWDQHPRGQTLEALAWLEQKAICQGWYAAFAMALMGAVFLLWIMVMAFRVFTDG